MSVKRRALMIGAGGMAGYWIHHFLPRFADRMEIVGLVDVNPEVLAQSGEFLGLAPGQRYSAMEPAFAEVEADFCIVVVPPAFHKAAVLQAAARQLDVLSEKPIADTWESCGEIYRAVKASGIKMAVMQNYRYNAPLLTLKKVLADGELGRINYIVARFAADYRVRNSWGKFRHEIPHSLLVEGSIHHFDQIRNLAGADCVEISGFDWNPAWSSFDGDCCGLYTMAMQNGVRAVYEGACTAAAAQNNWHGEAYRVECERGAAVIERDQTVRILQHLGGGRLRSEEVERVSTPYEGHQAVIDAFLNWLDGGPPPETVLDDNIKSAAMLFGAIEASEERRVVDLESMLAPLG